MSRFPDTFTPAVWQGARAKDFTQPEDAFQQLVGDALRHEFHGHAHITTTAGRDGAIDAWVDACVTSPARFAGMTLPLIVECKHHDEQAKDPAGNLEQGWNGVKKKLTKQAVDGWPGTYAPWRQARSYLYCTSYRFPHQAAREAFLQQLREFFAQLQASLPAANRPAIAPEQVYVWDWSDLAAWFNHCLPVCDRWLGLHLPEWRDHASERAQLLNPASGRESFLSYLLPERLPFIPPAVTDPSHPEQIFAALAKGEHQILTGEGGIGKTRTLYEVADLAVAEGWRVVHLIHSEQAIDFQTALQPLLAHPGDTLLLIDYIDQLAHFDAPRWRSQLLPAATARGCRLHLLSNARPLGASEAVGRLLNSELFHERPITRHPAQREAVAQAMEQKLCPRAIEQWRAEKVRALCGSRPIIAMFIARELEQLATNGEELPSDDKLPPPGDLLRWIRRRLEQDHLLPTQPQTPANDHWAPPAAPSPHLTAVVAALASSPLAPVQLTEVLATALVEQGHPPQDAARLLSRLSQSGWLEMAINGELRTPHDAVADTALGTLLQQHPQALPAILAPAHLGRPLGRLARSLGRLSSSLPAAQQTALTSASQRWLSTHATALGAALCLAEPNAVAYALGALFDYRPWSEAASAQWDHLIAPWLSQHGHTLNARHLLHRGLKHLPAATVAHLLAPALAWLAEHPRHPAATFVLAPLLGSPADRLGTVAQATVLQAALTWLAEPRNTTITEAEFVLNPLLTWEASRLGAAQATVLTAALAWLAETSNATASEASHILKPLLAWEESRLGAAQTTVLAVTLAWLAKPRNATASEAGFVLPPLLAWEASRLGAAQASVLTAALAWLAESRNATASDAGFVFAPLLAWEERQLGAAQASVLTAALAWLAETSNSTTSEARFVFKPLLGWEETRLGSAQPVVLAAALNWLRQPGHATSVDAGFVLPPLVIARGLTETARQQGMSWALAWVRQYLERDNATHLLKRVLQAVNRYPEILSWEQILEVAAEWLERFPQHGERPFVLARILRIQHLPNDFWEPIAQAGLDVLEREPYLPDNDFLLNGLVTRFARLSAKDQGRWLDRASDWVICSRQIKDVDLLFKNCRQFIPGPLRAHLISVLDSARAQRYPRLPSFDWQRPFANDYDLRFPASE